MRRKSKWRWGALLTADRTESVNMPTKKPKWRWTALVTAATTIGGVVLQLVTNPQIVAALPGKLAVAATVLGAIGQAITKPAVRDEQERHATP